jgi:hypothetical protein
MVVYFSSEHASSPGIAARDALGNDVVIEQWVKTHLPGDRSLVEVS